MIKSPLCFIVAAIMFLTSAVWSQEKDAETLITREFTQKKSGTSRENVSIFSLGYGFGNVAAGLGNTAEQSGFQGISMTIYDIRPNFSESHFTLGYVWNWQKSNRECEFDVKGPWRTYHSRLLHLTLWWKLEYHYVAGYVGFQQLAASEGLCMEAGISTARWLYGIEMGNLRRLYFALGKFSDPWVPLSDTPPEKLTLTYVFYYPLSRIEAGYYWRKLPEVAVHDGYLLKGRFAFHKKMIILFHYNYIKTFRRTAFRMGLGIIF